MWHEYSISCFLLSMFHFLPMTLRHWAVSLLDWLWIISPIGNLLRANYSSSSFNNRPPTVISFRDFVAARTIDLFTERVPSTFYKDMKDRLRWYKLFDLGIVWFKPDSLSISDEVKPSRGSCQDPSMYSQIIPGEVDSNNNPCNHCDDCLSLWLIMWPEQTKQVYWSSYQTVQWLNSNLDGSLELENTNSFFLFVFLKFAWKLGLIASFSFPSKIYLWAQIPWLNAERRDLFWSSCTNRWAHFTASPDICGLINSHSLSQLVYRECHAGVFGGIQSSLHVTGYEVYTLKIQWLVEFTHWDIKT